MHIATKQDSILKISFRKLPNGTLTKIYGPAQTEYLMQAGENGNTVIALRCRGAGRGTKGVLARLDGSGTALGQYTVPLDLSPLFFHHPDGHLWATFRQYGQVSTITGPVFEEADCQPLPQPQEKATYNLGTMGGTTYLLGKSKQFARPDTLLMIGYEKGYASEDRAISLVGPDEIREWILSEEGVHLFSVQEDEEGDEATVTHRLVTENGHVLPLNTFSATEYRDFRVLGATTDGRSQLLIYEGDTFYLGQVTGDGLTSREKLASTLSPISSLVDWVKLSGNTYLASFDDAGQGDGWLVIRDGRCLEAFQYEEGTGFRSLTGTEVILPEDGTRVLGFNATGHGYAISLFPVQLVYDPKKGELYEHFKPDQLYVLTRELEP